MQTKVSKPLLLLSKIPLYTARRLNSSYYFMHLSSSYQTVLETIIKHII